MNISPFFHIGIGRHWKHLWRHGCRPLPLERPDLHQLAQLPVTALPSQIERSSLACRYLDLLGPIDWVAWQQQVTSLSAPGPTPGSLIPFISAYLVKLDQSLLTMTSLRNFLAMHPELVWLLGFPLRPCTYQPWGFDLQTSLPSRNRWSQVLRGLDNEALQSLLTMTVQLLRQIVPPDCGFGQTISLDTKHVIAWVKENNPKAYIKESRFDKSRQPVGDKDCRLGYKSRSNQRVVRSTPHQEGLPASRLGVGRGEFYWGYASGVVATKVPGYGEFVLAEMTAPFNHSDASYFHPLMAQVEKRLGFAPPHGALDAAYDSHYVYDYFHQAGGFAAVPRVERGRDKDRHFSSDGLPLCDAQLPMPLKQTFMNYSSLIPHEKGRYVCPLLYPQPNGQSCPINHKKWPTGGCQTSLATSAGARIRHQLDRNSEAFKEIYRQRTAVERIFSQALTLGIERPKLRNYQSIANQNTLIYILINLRALARLRAEI